MEKRRTECPGLPSGWTREEVTRKSGLSAGKLDIYYYSPAGKKFRSKPQLTRALDGTIDLTSFDFRTGCMIARKQKNKHKLRGEGPASNKSASQSTLHLGTTIPIRQTASIFKQQITKVTNHPDNKVKPDPQKVLEPPKQVFWEKRLQGLSASDMAQEVIKAIDLSKLLQGVGPTITGDALLSTIACALHSGSEAITGQLSTGLDNNPAIWLNPKQPLCKPFVITDEDIWRQEEQVRRVRKRLEEAMMSEAVEHKVAEAEWSTDGV
uniref:methyl-CpG-binding domain protein 2-like isoform X1 n=1 Tax=Myxine glutinosa TaxID=7769 RepID=UPI00358E4316